MGVLIAINENCYCTEIVVDSDDSDYEKLFVRVEKDKCKFIVSTVYFSPTTDISSYIDFITQVEEIKIQYPHHSLIITGDFNLPNISWLNANILDYLPQPGITKTNQETVDIICENFKKLQLKQFNFNMEHVLTMGTHNKL